MLMITMTKIIHTLLWPRHDDNDDNDNNDNHSSMLWLLTGKKDTGMAIKMGDMHYRSDSLTFSADTLR